MDIDKSRVMKMRDFLNKLIELEQGDDVDGNVIRASIACAIEQLEIFIYNDKMTPSVVPVSTPDLIYSRNDEIKAKDCAAYTEKYLEITPEERKQANGNKIALIKKIREKTTLGLYEAKIYAEALIRDKGWTEFGNYGVLKGDCF